MEHFKEPVNRTFDDTMASVVKEVMSNKSELVLESEVEVTLSPATVDVNIGNQE